MGWVIKKIGSNKERLALAIRESLTAQSKADKEGGRGYGSAATAIEQALQAFGNVNGYLLQVDASGCIAADGKGILTLTIHTLDQDVIV